MRFLGTVLHSNRNRASQNRAAPARHVTSGASKVPRQSHACEGRTGLAGQLGWGLLWLHTGLAVSSARRTACAHETCINKKHPPGPREGVALEADLRAQLVNRQQPDAHGDVRRCHCAAACCVGAISRCLQGALQGWGWGGVRGAGGMVTHGQQAQWYAQASRCKQQRASNRMSRSLCLCDTVETR